MHATREGVFDFPAKLVAYIVGVPLHLVGSYVSRKRCPGCGGKEFGGLLLQAVSGRRLCALPVVI